MAGILSSSGMKIMLAKTLMLRRYLLDYPDTRIQHRHFQNYVEPYLGDEISP
jgi:hypothetical protein